jgi:hypothetical protein
MDQDVEVVVENGPGVVLLSGESLGPAEEGSVEVFLGVAEDKPAIHDPGDAVEELILTTVVGVV